LRTKNIGWATLWAIFFHFFGHPVRQRKLFAPSLFSVDFSQPTFFRFGDQTRLSISLTNFPDLAENPGKK
jgi:hypothetical protein